MYEISFTTILCIIFCLMIATSLSDMAKGFHGRFPNSLNGSYWVEGKGWKKAILEYFRDCAIICIIIKGGAFIIKFLMNNVTVTMG